ncbi:MAG TPA: type II toxin-antitoxin system VapC family toxin [Chthoniobacteraceae bacterium]|nr:type II toxin-antitoxin system VapC family toxin [Chthoniobacteraceae bacterium]
MLVLDTDHFSALERNSEIGRQLTARLRASDSEKALSIPTVQESLRGWLAEINRHQDLDRQIVPYAKLQQVVEALGNWLILSWDAECAALFRRFRSDGVRIGTLDLKIACIVLAHDATLLTRNERDFSLVPDLRFENWLD